MPLFDFENRETGEVREVRATPDLDNFSDGTGTWFKREVQPSFAIGGMQNVPSQSQMIKRGYYKQEQTGWKSGFSKNKVKKAWGL